MTSVPADTHVPFYTAKPQIYHNNEALHLFPETTFQMSTRTNDASPLTCFKMSKRFPSSFLSLSHFCLYDRFGTARVDFKTSAEEAKQPQ